MSLGKNKMTLQDVLEAYQPDGLLHPWSAPITNVNQRDVDGDTPLHHACWRRSLEEVEALVAAGADVNSTGDMGYRPIDVAVTQGDLQIVRLLVKHNATISHHTEFSQTTLEKAESLGDVQMIAFLQSLPTCDDK